MSDNPPSLNDPLLRGLAAAALSPALRSVLVFDLDPDALFSVAAVWAAMLETTTGRAVEVVRLGTSDAEDRLWGRWLPRARPHPGDRPRAEAAVPAGRLRWHRGLLGPAGPADPLRILLVPDLSRLDLPAVRACVQLVGAAVAHLERHGRHRAWRPDFCWLAACPRGELGRVSPHLLDRFALPLVVPTDAALPGVENLRRQISPRRRTCLGWLQDQFFGSLPIAVWLRLKRAARRATLPDAAARRVLASLPASASSSPRSLIALGRLAAALARLARRGEAIAADVDEAASLWGLISLAQPATAAGRPIQPPADNPIEIGPESPRDRMPEWLSADRPAGVMLQEGPGGTVDVPPPAEPFAAVSVPAPPQPPSVREGGPVRVAASLRLPPRRFRSGAAVGPVIGVRRATDLNDLSVVETLLEAVKWQPFRRRFGLVPPSGFSVSGLDLREYRRAPLPETMLVLLVDHTCLGRCRWEEALRPYIYRAYAERGSVCLIQVGAAGGRDDDPRAERILARNLLVPRVFQALHDGPGRATPLAHGLDLALQTIRHAARQGAGPVYRIRFVLVTDGRGNVPLERNPRGGVDQPVGSAGITSALRVAQAFREFDQVEIILLDPQPEHYPELPRQLARALGATIEPIDRPEEDRP